MSENTNPQSLNLGEFDFSDADITTEVVTEGTTPEQKPVEEPAPEGDAVASDIEKADKSDKESESIEVEKDDNSEEIKGEVESDDSEINPDDWEGDYKIIQNFTDELAADLNIDTSDDGYKDIISSYGDRLKEGDELTAVMRDFMRDVISQNSVPEYASEESRLFDEALKNNIDPREYFEKVYGNINISTLDPESETDGKKIAREYYERLTKFNDGQIKRDIDRIFKGEDWQEEVKAMHDSLKDDDARLAKEAEKEARENIMKAEKERVNQIEKVKNQIYSAEEIDGHKLSRRDKDEIYRYAFKPTNSGKTRYQEDMEDDKFRLRILKYAALGSSSTDSDKKIQSEAVKIVRDRLSRYTDNNVKKQTNSVSVKDKNTKQVDGWLESAHSRFR